jgi:hypothetical protein
MDDNGAVGEAQARCLEWRRNGQLPVMHIQSRLERICKMPEEKVK